MIVTRSATPQGARLRGQRGRLATGVAAHHDNARGRRRRQRRDQAVEPLLPTDAPEGQDRRRPRDRAATSGDSGAPEHAGGSSTPCGMVTTGGNFQPKPARWLASTAEVVWTAAARSRLVRSISDIQAAFTNRLLPRISSGTSMPRGEMT